MDNTNFENIFVYVQDQRCGVLSRTDEGYEFKYDENYLKNENAMPVSITVPLTNVTYKSKILFPFFDGLIPEGWLLDIVCKNWKINSRDRFNVLKVACADPIGDVHISVK